MEQADLDLLIEALAEFQDDPYGYVMFAYPWGEPGALADYHGPEQWQEDLLKDLGNGLVSVSEAIAIARAREEEVECQPLLKATTSGHGIGKSACVSWIIDWAQATMVDTKGVVTANTENQLKTKTWAELAKWHRMSISKPLFKMTATSRFSIDPDHEKTWRIDMTPWSEKNMEAFAGLHNKGRRILIIFDEASAIADLIWETTEGALTDKNTQIIWCCFGNPTKNSGRFRNCFEGGEFSHRWDTRAVDSREVSITNKTQIQNWIDDYGEDHDFVRVRVRGMFPRVDANSFISFEIARAAATRELPEHNPFRVVLGVDCARYGDDASVIYPRRGRDARSIPPRVYRQLSVTQLANKVYDAYVELFAVAVFVDSGAMGAGVVDILLDLGVPVYEVTFGGSDDNPDHSNPNVREKYANKRAAIWGAGREWLKTGCIPEKLPTMEHTLADEMSGPTYTYVREDYVQLESKRDMKRRGIPSPDGSDALFCTFAYPALSEVSTADTRKPEYYERSPNDMENPHAKDAQNQTIHSRQSSYAS